MVGFSLGDVIPQDHINTLEETGKIRGVTIITPHRNTVFVLFVCRGTELLSSKPWQGQKEATQDISCT